MDYHTRLVFRLREQAEDIRRIVAGLDESLQTAHPQSGRWSLKELVCHLWRVQEVFESRIEAMLTDTNPSLEPYGPDNDREFEEKMKSPGCEVVEGLLADREELVALMESLSPADWRQRGIHPEYSRYDVQFAIEYLAHHEAHHIYQMFQRRALVARPHP